jgi:hypothetical protein
MTKELEIFRMSDGFWAGHQTADKKRMKAGAHKITADEIMTMFTEFFTDYCKETGESKLLMQDASGGLFVTMRVPAHPAQPAQQPPKKRKKRRDNG